MVTIQDLENSLDEIVTLYTLIKPEELSFSYSEANYYNSLFYKSPLYKFIKNLSVKQREIINTSIIIGYWLYSSPESIKYCYLEDLKPQCLDVINVEKWCAKIICDFNVYKYLKIFLEEYFNINIENYCN